MFLLKSSFYFLLTLILACNSTGQKSEAPSQAPSLDTLRPASETSDTLLKNEELGLEEEILGSWQWWKTKCCGRTPQISYADSSKPLILKFEATGNLQTIEDDSTTNAQLFEISYGLMNDTRPVLKIGNKQPALLYIKTDTLIIDYGYMDLQTEFYLRKK